MTATQTADQTAKPCTHDGNLRGLCPDCIRKHMDANLGFNGVEVSDEGCAVIRDVIDEFCARHESFYGVEALDEDLAARITEHFTYEDDADIVGELIEILLFG